MEDSLLSISKDMFVSIKKENINNYYEVIAKVKHSPLRNWEREPSVPSTKDDLTARKDLGEL
jgi:hypothetical protein